MCVEKLQYVYWLYRSWFYLTTSVSKQPRILLRARIWAVVERATLLRKTSKQKVADRQLSGKIMTTHLWARNVGPIYWRASFWPLFEDVSWKWIHWRDVLAKLQCVCTRIAIEQSYKLCNNTHNYSAGTSFWNRSFMNWQINTRSCCSDNSKILIILKYVLQIFPWNQHLYKRNRRENLSVSIARRYPEIKRWDKEYWPTTCHATFSSQLFKTQAQMGG